jgi:quinol monooxygenase YgiN
MAPMQREEGAMLSIVAVIKVKAGAEQDFEAVAKDLVAKVNASEPGCRLYTLSRSNEAPQTYVFMERYVDQAAVDHHRSTDHYKELGRKMGQFMEGRPDVLRMTEV